MERWTRAWGGKWDTFLHSVQTEWVVGRRKGLQAHPAPLSQVCCARSPGWPARTAVPWRAAQAAKQAQAVSMVYELWPSAILMWSSDFWSAQRLVSACSCLLSGPKAVIFHASLLCSQPTRVSSAYLQDKPTFLIYHENKFHDELREGVLKI